MPKPDLLPCISLWMPWANWVALGWKRIETRTHQRFRSLIGQRIGIHAAQKWDASWLEAAGPYLWPDQRMQTAGFLKVGGAVICTAYVADHRRLYPRHEMHALIECTTPRWGLVLENVKAIEAIPCRGGRGIFYVEVPE